MQPLPIDSLLPGIVADLLRARALVLRADPGAGKTTRVPRALFQSGEVEGKILVIEPRRLAARLAALRVAEELGEAVGERAGYRVRFDERSGPATRILFMTEGLLLRQLESDPELHGVGAVLLDEFHERHLQGDVALALVDRLRRSRRSLCLAVMSATLDPAPIAAYLGDCPVVSSEGRRFDVSIEYAADPAQRVRRLSQGQPPERTLGKEVAQALRQLARDGLDGDVLVFLPGMREIREVGVACTEVARQLDLEIAPLHGELSPKEQDRAVRRSRKRKLILSTNVAETSVTIEGVVAVIDSGLHRLAAHSPWSGLPSLRVAPISQAAAAQRAGRAGRTRPGRCIRLFTRHDHDARPAHETPEVRRGDLAETVLRLAGLGIRDPRDLGWFESPSSASLEAASQLLRLLGAQGSAGDLTEIGRRMLCFPVHPRLGRLLCEAESRGVGKRACTLVALVGEREIVRERPRRATERGPSDLLADLERFEEAARDHFEPYRLRAAGLDAGAVMAVERARQQLSGLVLRGAAARAKDPAPLGAAQDEALQIALLTAYPDRVARRRRPGEPEVILSGGGTARVAESSVVNGAPFLVAVDVEARSLTSGPGQVIVRSASAIDPDWLLDLFPDRLFERVDYVWNAEAERVDVLRRLTYDQLLLDERQAPASRPAADIDRQRVAALLAEVALSGGGAALGGVGAMERLFERIAFVRSSCPEVGLPALDATVLPAILTEACQGRSSLAELAEAGMEALVLARLDSKQQRQLAELAPERVRLAGGRELRVTYTAGQPPSIASRLQDFFGMKEGPTIARGRALVLHLLAPNRRAVQVTSDLAGFWARTYPGLRRELCRRYPRHSWPENP